MIEWLTKAINLVLDIIYPRLCIICAHRLSPDEQAVCNACGADLPLCTSLIAEAEQRLFSSPIFGKLYSAFVYHKGNKVQRLIHAFKYHGRADVALYTSRCILLLHPELSHQQYDLIIAIPTDPLRYAKREYNQALLLAEHLSSHLHAPATDRVIRRHSGSHSQTALSKIERLGNVGEAFYLGQSREQLRGMRILLVDDVLTSGATLSHALALLEQAGASRVDVCTASIASS